MSKNRPNPILISYVPHGLNPTIYYPITDGGELKNLEKFRSNLFKEDKDFVLFFNSRNIRRKQIPDTLLAFRYFLDGLPKEKADKCAFILHTDVISEHGTDLEKVRSILLNDYPQSVYFSQDKLSVEQLNLLYNVADVQILLTSNEGWGLTLTEALLSGTPIIGNVTGGMQDQMGFKDDDGNWFTPTPEIPSNHTGKYKEHGEWAFPVFPTNRSIQGSPKTPYIWDDRCRPEDAAEQIRAVYDLPSEKRKELGLKGREWAMSEEVGFTSEHMGNRMINAVDQLFNTWKPREKYNVINVNDIKEPKLNHELLY